MFDVQVWTCRPALPSKIPRFILLFLQENSGVLLELSYYNFLPDLSSYSPNLLSLHNVICTLS